MRYLKIPLMITILIILGACTTPPSPSPLAVAIPVSPTLENPEDFNDKDRDTCTTAGGQYEMGGLLGYFRCTMDYADGGKTCSDTSECGGQCLATETSKFDPHKIIENQTGICQMNDNPFGCYEVIVKGVVQPTLCMD